MGLISDVLDFTGVGALLGWLTPELPKQKLPGAELTSAETDANISKIYGTVQKHAGTIVFKETNDVDDDDIKNDLLHIIVVWGERVQSIDEVYLDDIPYSSDDDAFYHDDGGKVVYVVNFPNGMAGYNDPVLDQAGWRTDDRLDGKACSYIRLEYHGGETAINSEPNLTADITGTTFSNPATALKDYLTNSIYGKGLPSSLLNLPSFAYAEALCNADVEEQKDGGVMRDLFTCNIALDTGNTVLENVNKLLKPMRGWLPIVDGKLKLIIEEDSTPVDLPIYEEDILQMGKIKEGNKNSRYNRVSVTYREPSADGTKQEAVYPEKNSAIYDALLEEDNGFPAETSVDLATCRNYYEALEFAKTYLEVSRQQLRTTITLPKWATIYEVGDIVPVHHSFPGWEGKLFRIESIEENREEVTLSVREHQPYIYDFFGEGNKPELPDTTYVPGTPDAPTDLDVTHIYSNFVQVRVSWVSLAQRFDYRVLKGSVIVKTERIGAKSIELSGFDLGEYRFQVRALSGLGKRSGWAEIPLIMQEPGIPTLIEVNESNFELEVIPYLAGSDSSTAFRFALSNDLTDSEPPLPHRGPAHTYSFPGLQSNTEYKVWVQSFNALGESAWVSVAATTTADASAIADMLSPVFEPIDIKLEELRLNFDDIDSRFIDFSNRFEEFEAQTLAIQKQEQITREQAEALLLQSISENAAYQLELARRVEAGEELTNAVVYRDPQNGLIVNRAYQYADNRFTEAALIIDGVEGEVSAAVQRIENTENEVTNLSSELALIPGAITATATAIVSESLSALEPAHAFNFFDSAQGWQAVNGTLTAGVNEITVTHGDIENATLDYLASENKLIRVSIERLAGSGWSGTVIIEKDDATVETYANYIDESSILLIDFSALSSYSGTINRVRLVFGESTDDEFKITSIVIGKADATTQDLANITARVTQAEIDISANDAAITQRVTTSFFESNAITFSNVEQTINALDSIIALEATRQQLIEDDVITKANSAAIFINGATGSIQQLVQDFEQGIDAVETSIIDVQQQINGLGISEQVAGLASAQIQTYDAQAGLLQQAVNDLTGYLANAENEQSVALAVNQLQIDVSPEGSLAKDISSLQSATVINGNAITATNQRLSQVETDAEGNASAIEQLNLDVSSINTALSGSLSRIDAVEIDANQNATALSALQGRASSIEGDVESNFALATEAKSTADGNASTINQVQIDVLGLNSSLSSAITRIDSVEVDAENNATAISALQGKATNFEGDISANFALAQQAKTTADNNATAISNLETSVNDSTTGLSATNTIAQQAKITAEDADGKADANATAITSISSRVTGAENDATSAINLVSGLDSELDEYRAIAQLAVDSNGNVSLIQLDATPSISQILFKASQLSMVDQDNTPRVFWDAGKGTFVFNGEVRAEAGYFKGLLQSAKTENIGSNFMELSDPDGFGPDNLSYYFGPKFMSGGSVNYSLANKANANQWRDTSGNLYTGGTLSAGVISNAARSTTLSENPSTVLGPFSSNGNPKNVVFSYEYAANSTVSGQCQTYPATPSCTVQLEKKTGTGNWQLLQTKYVTGGSNQFYEPELGGCVTGEDMSGSWTYTDTSTGTANITYRVVVSNTVRYHEDRFVDSQVVSITSVEE